MPRVCMPVCRPLGLTAVAALLSVAAAGAADWPQFLGPNRDGTTAEAGVILAAVKGAPKRVWEYGVGAGWSGPVVSAGRVLIFHRQGDDVCLDCLSAADGRRLWRSSAPTSYRDPFRFDEGPRATPAVADGRVYLLGADGACSAVGLEDGRRLWQRDLQADYRVPESYFGAACSPLVEGRRVIVCVGGPAAGIVALDGATGKEVWKSTDDGASYSSPIAATVNGQRVVIAFTREGLVVLDPTSGAVRVRERWRSRLRESVNAATPLIAGDQLFLSACYGTGAAVWQLRPGGVSKLWSGDHSLSNHYNTSVHRDGFLYGIDGRQEGGAQLRCVEWATGKVRWTAERFGCATLALAGGLMLAMNENGELVAFDARPEAYRERLRVKVLGEPVRAAFALADGRLYARDGAKLVAIDLTGK